MSYYTNIYNNNNNNKGDYLYNDSC